MLFNKYTYRKTNDKKLLHKIGKRWVTVSIAMLALLGGSFAMKSVTTHADTITPAVEAQKTNNVKTQLNKGLDQAYSEGVHKQSAQATNSVGSSSASSATSSSASSSAVKPSAVQSQATNMYRGLMANAVSNQNKQSGSTTTESSANSNVSNQGSSKVASSSATNSDSNASTPNYIEDNAHYNLGSYNARKPQSTENQKEAYANYLKQNPQLANLYNETATQSGSNNVANSKVALNAPKNSVSASSIASNSSASSVSANNNNGSSANQINDKKNKPLMKVSMIKPLLKTGSIVSNGKWGNASWNLDNNGHLTLSGQFPNTSYNGGIRGSFNKISNLKYPNVRSIGFNHAIAGNDLMNTFAYMPNLTSVDFDGLDTSQTKDFAGTFSTDYNLSHLYNMSNLVGSNAQSLDSMFTGDSSLTNLDVSNWNTSNVKYWGSAFANLSKLQNINGLGSLNMNNAADLNDAFMNDSSLQSLDLHNFNTWSARHITHSGNGGNGLSNFISGCNNLRHLNLGPQTVLTPQAINGSTNGSYALGSNGIPLALADGRDNTTTNSHVGNWTLLQNVSGQGHWGKQQGAAYVVETHNGNVNDLYISNGSITLNRSDAKNIDWNSVNHIYTNDITVPTMNNLFINLPNVQSINCSGIKSVSSPNYDGAFNGDNNLQNLIGFKFFTNNPETNGMFQGTKLGVLDLSSLNSSADVNNTLLNSNIATLILGPNTHLATRMGLSGTWINLNSNNPQSVSSQYLEDGKTHQGIWTRNAQFINLQYNDNTVYSNLVKGTFNTSDTVENTPIFVPMEYKLDNNSLSQKFTYSGGITDVPVELTSTYNSSVANSIANSAEAIAENSANGTIAADSKALNSDISKINSLTNNNTSLSNEVSYANSGASNADALDSAIINVLSNGSYNASGLNTNDTTLLSSIATKYSNWNNASAQANDADLWVKANSASLNNASTIANNAKASANEAMSSLNNDSSALQWLVNSLGSVESEATQASSNASWIKANSASVSTLSSGWTSVEADISKDSTALNQAISSKANSSDLTNDYSKLSGDITNASSLANTANKLANTNSGEISNLKSNTAITFSFSQDGNSNVQIPITMTNGYIIKNAESDDGNNTYNITNLLNSAVSSKGKHVVGKYTVTLGTDNKGDATITYNAPQTAPKHQLTLGMSAPSTNDDMNTFTLGTPNQQRKAWNYVQYGLNNHRGLMLGASNPSQVPSSTDTAHNVVLANNQAEYTGTITLNFGEYHQAKLNFDTGSTNPNVLASDTVNLLNYAKNAQKPSDFTKDKLINGFDTTGFKFDSTTSTPNKQYSFTIQPSDATNQTGADVHNNYNITLNYTAQPVTENIQYVYGTHTENKQGTTTTTTGNDDSQGNWKDTTNLKPGWQLANGTNNPFTFTNNGTAKVNVTPVQTTDTINYMDQKGNKVGSQTFTGNNYQATDAGNNSVDVTKDNDTKLDKNYKLKNTDNSFKYDGGTYTVNVIGNARSPKNTIPSSTKPSDANNPKSNKNMQKPSGDSDVLFTINVRDYNADGTKEINHYTKYTTESGEVGDPFTIKASDYLTNGFNIEPSKSKDSDVSGTIGDNQLQPNSVTFNYYAKASTFDPNKAKTDPNYVKHYNSDPTTPKPISVQYIGELNGKANQVVQSDNNVITGNTGDTGTLSNIESVTKVPKGYTVRGNNYNYTITTAPQTIKVYLNSETAKQMNNGGQNYKPTTPSDKPSSKVPSDNTVKKDASHGFATIIINENINGKLAHQSAKTVDESNLNVGNDYTLSPANFTPNGYQVQNSKQAITGTVNGDGSLSVKSATFDYDVNSSEIAPIYVTYYNQYGDLVDANSGKSKLTGEDVTPKQATVTIQPVQLATKGAVGDYVDITGFLTAPKGHHFNKKIVDSSNKDLTKVILQQAKGTNSVHLGLMLFATMPKPKPNSSTNKPNSSASAKSNTSNSSVPSSSSNVAPSNSTNPFTPIMPNVIPNSSASASNTESSATSQSVAPSSVASAKSSSRSAKPSSAEKHVNHTTKINHKRSILTKHSVKSVVSGKAKHARNITTTKATTSLNNMNHQVATKGATHQTTNAKSINESINNSSASVVSGVATNSNATESEPITNVANNDNEATTNSSVSPESTAESNVTMPNANAESDKQNTITNNNNNDRKKLPQTNEASSHSVLVAIVALLAGLSLMGVDLYRKHNN